MKTNPWQLRILIFLTLLSSLFSCQESEVKPVQIKKEGKVSFQIGYTNTNGRTTEEEAVALVISIEDGEGNVIYNAEKLPLYNFDDNQVSQPLSLTTGNYYLTSFLVVDGEGNVIYATPKEDSELAHLVTHPLPSSFAVATDEVTTLVPQVVSTEAFIPAEFGYVEFKFTEVTAFRFLAAAFVYDTESNALAPTTAEITIVGEGNELYTGDLATGTNTITLPSSYTTYTLSVKKEGYVVYTKEFPQALLAAYQTDVLEVILLENNGIPSLVDSGQTLGSVESEGVELGDLDGDGDLDAFVMNASACKVWLNDGNGNFTDSGQNIMNYGGTSVSLGDLDGDGDLDAYIINFSLNDAIWLNDGTGHFTMHEEIENSNNTLALALSDVDGDGDVDAFITEWREEPENSGNIAGGHGRVLLNDGAANFTNTGQSLNTGFSFEVRLGDLDGDSDIDAFVVSNDFNGVENTIWLNDGNGVFTDSGQDVGSNGSRIVLFDLDNDGDLDAVTSGLFPQSFNTVWLNNGSGHFSNSGNLIEGGVIDIAEFGDFDTDGNVDVLLKYQENFQPKIALLLNNGEGTWSDNGQDFSDLEAPNYFDLGDLDGDGKPDAFFTASAGSLGNKVFFNRPLE